MNLKWDKSTKKFTVASRLASGENDDDAYGDEKYDSFYFFFKEIQWINMCYVYASTTLRRGWW